MWYGDGMIMEYIAHTFTCMASSSGTIRIYICIYTYTHSYTLTCMASSNGTIRNPIQIQADGGMLLRAEGSSFMASLRISWAAFWGYGCVCEGYGCVCEGYRVVGS